MNMENKIRTVGELKEFLKNIPDDFTIQIQTCRALTDAEMMGMRYPYPWEVERHEIDGTDTGWSDKNVLIRVEMQ